MTEPYIGSGQATNRDHRIRVGAVSYLNTKPLVYRLTDLAPRIELTFDLPSRLSDRLASADLDVALVPSIEYLQDPSYSVVSDACIACHGPVLSVKLLARVPLTDIQTLALDEGSRTSVALVRILLQQKLGRTPKLVPFPIGLSPQQVAADAVLVIGDRAIHPPEDEFVAAWDLGDTWCRWSELPFVFAMWVARAGVDLAGLDAVLSEARDEGVRHLEQIARHESPLVGLEPQVGLDYFRHNLHFTLGPREQQGLHLFYKHAVALNLAPDDWDPAQIGLVVQ